MLEEYLVSNCSKVARFIDDKIGIDYEVSLASYSDNGACSITVFEITYSEHQKLREFISKWGLWSE